MADPLSQLGIARRPVYELFGRPDTSQGGWSAASREAAAEDQYLMDQAEQAAEAKRERMRAQQAEQVADEYMGQTEPTARQKFLEENPAIAGSKRYNQIAKYQKALPSYADKTLRNSILSKYKDPEAQRMFNQLVDEGHGTFNAKNMTDEFLDKRKRRIELAQAGIPLEEHEEILSQGPEYAAYHIAKKKREDAYHQDPEVRALEKRYGLAKDQASLDIKNPVNDYKPTPETEKTLKEIKAKLEAKYQSMVAPQGEQANAASANEFARLPSSMFAPAVPTEAPKQFRSPPGTGLFGEPLNAPAPAAAPAKPMAQMSNEEFARSSAPAPTQVSKEESAKAKRALLEKYNLVNP